MRKIHGILVLLVIGFLTGCSVEPEPINYGSDQCDFCQMNVVDKTHAAQYVTAKGKQYKFDAIECLIRELADKKINESDLAFVLVADYGNPGNMIDAKGATYIVSKAIKSPMGAYLSAFSDEGTAQSTVAEKGGKVYNWEEVKTHVLRK